MQSIRQKIIDNYRYHPAFTFSTAALELNEQHVERFTQAYSEISLLGGVLRESSRRHASAQCFYSLRGIFAELKKEVLDLHEVHFMEELQLECERLLDEEVRWYTEKVGARSVELEHPKSRAEAIRLRSERHYFSLLSPAVVVELRLIAEDSVSSFKANAAAGKVTRDDLSINSGSAVRAIRAILNREFRRLGVLDAVSAYTGRQMRVTGLALELSVPQATWWANAIDGIDRAPRTLYAHLDESIVFPKAIVYLSDVAESNGPTSCYPGAYEAMELNALQQLVGRVVGNVGAKPNSPLRNYYAKQYHQSMNSQKFRQHFMRLPTSVRFNSHLGWDVAPDSELEAVLADNERVMTGPAGTFIVFDGARLLHRGGMVQQADRLALQVIFSDTSPWQQATAKIKRLLI